VARASAQPFGRSVLERTRATRSRAPYRLAFRAVQQLAPCPVPVAAGFRAPEQRAVRRDERIVRPLARRKMIVAPLHVQDFEEAVGKWLAAGTIGASDRSLLRRDVRHDPGLEISRRR
jgi:hypothetical protein